MVERAPGALIAGRYEIVRRLGRGGMGEVYEAIQRPLDRRVALKLLSERSGDDATARRRFETEAALIGRLRHPNNITLFDYGHAEDGSPYLVMALCGGTTLAERLGRDGRLAPARALAIGAQLCDALTEAHGLGIVHRDLKPQNIMLEPGAFGPDTVRVLDYGIARAADRPELTAPGRIVGTPAYMAPEQARGAGVDHRADIYALGAVLYRMLAGALPIVAEDPRDLFAAIQTRVPLPLDRVEPPVAVDSSVAAIVQLALAKQPEHRPGSAALIAEALRAAVNGSSGSEVPSALTLTADGWDDEGSRSLDEMASMASRDGMQSMASRDGMGAMASRDGMGVMASADMPSGDMPSGDMPSSDMVSSDMASSDMPSAPSTPSAAPMPSADASLSMPDGIPAASAPATGRRAGWLLAALAALVGLVWVIRGVGVPDGPPGLEADAARPVVDAARGGPPVHGDAQASSPDAAAPDAAVPDARRPAPPSDAAPPVRPARRIRVSGCRVTAAPAALCDAVPRRKVVACHGRSARASQRWRVRAIVRSGQTPRIDLAGASEGAVACLADALRAVTPPPGHAFATVEFTVGR